MRAVLTSFGTTGDVQPLLALAIELRDHGHTPVLACSPNYAARVEQLGLAFAPLGPQLARGALREMSTQMLNAASPDEQVRRFLDATLSALPDMFGALQGICRQADVLISTPFQLAGRMVHETSGIPFVSVHFSQFGALGNKAVRDISAPPINQYRAEVGLPPLPDPLSADAVSPQLALYAVSPRLLRRPASWPEHHHVTGFFFLDEGWQPDADLAEFIAAGPEPIVVSFGSMMHQDPEALTELMLAAIEQTGRRAIVQHGWSGLARRALPPHVRAIDFAPHSWLLPRAACVVHHGGAGTTAAALRAGVPAVIVPHTLDQPIWAEFARALGCAGAVIPLAQLSAERLAAALVKTLGTPRYRAAAAAMGEQIRAERGVQAARELIERLVTTGIIGGQL
jgi:sterol 3beta-glucosyltransferase